jgi:hypothetical protein
MTEAVDPFTLSAEEAGDKLAAMTKEFRGEPSKDPRDVLAQRYKWPAWVEKLEAGHPDVLKEFHELTKAAGGDKSADKIDLAIAGVLEDTTFQDKRHVDNVRTAEFLRGSGIDDPAILRQVLSNESISQQEVDAAKAMKNRLTRDLEWTKRYLSNEGEAVRQMALLNVVLTRPVKQESAA